MEAKSEREKMSFAMKYLESELGEWVCTDTNTDFDRWLLSEIERKGLRMGWMLCIEPKKGGLGKVYFQMLDHPFTRTRKVEKQSVLNLLAAMEAFGDVVTKTTWSKGHGKDPMIKGSPIAVNTTFDHLSDGDMFVYEKRHIGREYWHKRKMGRNAYLMKGDGFWCRPVSRGQKVFLLRESN